MNTNMSARGKTIFYIILVPVILLVILLNSGLLQKNMTAVTIDGQKYTAVEYNYYYYSIENQYIEEHSDDLSQLGFDQSISLKNQQRDDGMSWWEYFCEQTEERMAEVYFLNTQAVSHGYSFSEEELAPIQEKVAQAEADAAENKITFENYLVAYYGSGITQEKWEELLTMETKADAYLAYLKESYQADETQISEWIAAHASDTQYDTADLSMIILHAGKDRETEETGERELTALSSRVNELKERYISSRNTFEELSEQFGEDEELAALEGKQTNVLKEELPQALATWCYERPRSAGDVTTAVDDTTGMAYFVIYDGKGEASGRAKAYEALSNEATQGSIQTAVEGYTTKRSSLGMKLIDR
jgi:hypothetical protein